MVRRWLSILLALTVVVAGAWAALAAITPVKVFDPPASQSGPYRNASWLLYAADSKDHPRHWDVFARPIAGGTPTKMNASGTKGWTGGFDPGTNTAIYQEYTSGDSDIRFFNLDTMTRQATPRPLQTGAWEFDPHISTAYMSFFRWQKVNGIWYAKLYLLDRSDNSLTTMASIQSQSGQYFLSDFLGEHYATWTVCSKTCTVRVYNIDTPGVAKLPSTSDNKPQYGSAIDETTASA
ncbi:MAG: hypothetical protein ABJB55_01250 [Actinomycetota bacterium]